MTLISEGAEARIYREDGIIRKVRIAKAYRHPRLDERLRISRTRAEARILERLSSLPSIPRLLTSEADTLCIEAINAPPIGIMHPDTIRQHAAQLANMLREIHTRNIAHGDVTPHNVLYDKGTYWLIDFGLAIRTQRIEDFAYDIAMTAQTFVESEGFSDALRTAYLALLDDKERTVFSERIRAIHTRGRHKTKGLLAHA